MTARFIGRTVVARLSVRQTKGTTALQVASRRRTYTDCMKAIRLAGALLLSSLVLPVHAGVVYHFTTRIESRQGSTTSGGKVWATDRAYRYEGDGGAARKAVISDDRDLTTYVLDLDGRTFYRQQRSPEARSSRLFHLPFKPQRIADCPAVEHTSTPGERIAGHATMLHTITVTYRIVADVDDSTVGATIRATAHVWAAESLPPLPMTRDLKTGFADIDRQLAMANAEVDGMVLRHELEVARTYDGGAPDVETTKTVVDELKIASVDSAIFRVPQDFVPDPSVYPAPKAKKGRR
jgi:hypothetical protein